ncbi:hypothetical protein SKAU_G00013460 [Synaphobranchus kaupii]|uniref:Uncharacterized protein n=1 Tax=Synaphobranchus kaupii TaxID=118154 RepID=A0A9Q1GBM2_SYNKA|nr:hypothetical protein SKAU_G00013460 [Synaphobranchus kaupii]
MIVPRAGRGTGWRGVSQRDGCDNRAAERTGCFRKCGGRLQSCGARSACGKGQTTEPRGGQRSSARNLRERKVGRPKQTGMPGRTAPDTPLARVRRTARPGLSAVRTLHCGSRPSSGSPFIHRRGGQGLLGNAV